MSANEKADLGIQLGNFRFVPEADSQYLLLIGG